MANLIVTEYAGIASGGGDRYGVPVPRQHNATQVLAITGAAVQSAPVEGGTGIVRVFAEADCMIKVGPGAEAAADDGFALASGQFDYVEALPGWVVSVVSR